MDVTSLYPDYSFNNLATTLEQPTAIACPEYVIDQACLSDICSDYQQSARRRRFYLSKRVWAADCCIIQFHGGLPSYQVPHGLFNIGRAPFTILDQRFAGKQSTVDYCGGLPLPPGEGRITAGHCQPIVFANGRQN